MEFRARGSGFNIDEDSRFGEVRVKVREREREFFIDNLLVRVHHIIVMIK